MKESDYKPYLSILRTDYTVQWYLKPPKVGSCSYPLLNTPKNGTTKSNTPNHGLKSLIYPTPKDSMFYNGMARAMSKCLLNYLLI